MITTDDCTFDKKTGDLYLSSRFVNGRFPREISIKSTYTGRTMTFVPIPPEHPRFDEDGWDGELSLYVPRDVMQSNVRVLTIGHDQ